MTDQLRVRALALAVVVLIGLSGIGLVTVGDSDSDARRAAARTTTTTGVPVGPEAAVPGPAVTTVLEPVEGGTAAPPASADSRGNDAPAASPATLEMYGTHAELKPEDMYPMDPRPEGFETVTEGKRADGSNWQMYADHQDSGDICVRGFAWDNRTGRGGGGGHSDSGCPAAAGWGWTLSDDDLGYVAVLGFAPGAVAEIVLVADDGREGKLPGVVRNEMGVTFFLAWIKCESPDLSRLEARDAAGNVIGSHDMKMHGHRVPSTYCELAARR